MGGRTSPVNCREVSSKHTTGAPELRLVQVLHVLHPRHELPAHLGDTPLFLLPGLEFVFLSIWRTGRCSRQTPTPPPCRPTTGVSNAWTFALHAKAIRCVPAVQLALLARPRSVIDGGLKSFLHVPLPRSGDRGTNSTSAISRSRSPFSFEQRQRTLHGAH